jgi:hypothetical protein
VAGRDGAHYRACVEAARGPFIIYNIARPLETLRANAQAEQLKLLEQQLAALELPVRVDRDVAPPPQPEIHPAAPVGSEAFVEVVGETDEQADEDLAVEEAAEEQLESVEDATLEATVEYDEAATADEDEELPLEEA